MSVYYVDTSALAKRYIRETGSIWFTGIAAPESRNALFVASLAAVEMSSAVARRRKAGDLSATDAESVLARCRADFESQYRIIEISPLVILDAISLAESRCLRAPDAIELAAAKLVHVECTRLNLTLTLLSADGELNKAARDEGLTVDDPNEHP